MGEFLSLDGLAGPLDRISVVRPSGTRFLPSFVSTRRDLGNLGVRVFFAISGILITKLLIEEHTLMGRYH